MLKETQIAELQTLTPELGIFTITGTMEDMSDISRDFKARSVSNSTFERFAYGKGRMALVRWF